MIFLGFAIGTAIMLTLMDISRKLTEINKAVTVMTIKDFEPELFKAVAEKIKGEMRNDA